MRGTDVEPDATVELVRAAKTGDARAWDRLIERFWERWVSRYDRDLGTTIRRLYDAEDLVQSAVIEAARSIESLREEGAFYVWVTAIIRHKLARKRASVRGEGVRRGSFETGIEPARDGAQEESVATDEEYLRVLDAILSLFPEEPDTMAAVVLAHLEGLGVEEIVARLGRPRRTVYSWIRRGEGLLRKRLELA
ncbi:MAG: RNA polymerase sigma factor [Planctomycetes bacterium]|nr:RNA polymerase sigma factor [Planctomycetota bacterium]